MVGISSINANNTINNLGAKTNSAPKIQSFLKNIKETADTFISSKNPEKPSFLQKIGNSILNYAKGHPVMSAIGVFGTLYGSFKFLQFAKHAPKPKTEYTPEFSPEMQLIYDAIKSGQISGLPNADGSYETVSQQQQRPKLPNGRTYIPSSEPIERPVDNSTSDQRFLDIMKQADDFEKRLKRSGSVF